MNSAHNYRLYSFVANGYLSPLQCGLQTAHAVGDMSVKYRENDKADLAYRTWAEEDKVIIICAAFNSKGVLDCATELTRTADLALCLPVSIFREDEDSLGGAATACAVVVPQKYWDTVWYKDSEGEIEGWTHICSTTFVHTHYPLTHPEGQFINHIKQYRLA